MGAENFHAGTGDGGFTYSSGLSLPTVAVLFPKIDGDGRARRGWVLVTGLQTLACLGLLVGTWHPWAKARLPGRWNRAKRSAATGDLKPPGLLQLCAVCRI